MWLDNMLLKIISNELVLYKVDMLFMQELKNFIL